MWVLALSVYSEYLGVSIRKADGCADCAILYIIFYEYVCVGGGIIYLLVYV